jgi:hypothetical protein
LSQSRDLDSGAISVKQKLLTDIGYGTGGIFIWVRAESAEQLKARFPKLRILDCPPTWMDWKRVQKLESEESYDIDSAELAKMAT